MGSDLPQGEFERPQSIGEITFGAMDLVYEPMMNQHHILSRVIEAKRKSLCQLREAYTELFGANPLPEIAVNAHITLVNILLNQAGHDFTPELRMDVILQLPFNNERRQREFEVLLSYFVSFQEGIEYLEMTFVLNQHPTLTQKEKTKILLAMNRAKDPLGFAEF